jgi:hypothetical protein
MPPELHAIDAEPPGADVIEKLEEALATAREGKLSSVAIAVVYRDGKTGRSWSNAPSVPLLIGSIARLEAALIRKIDVDV